MPSLFVFLHSLLRLRGQCSAELLVLFVLMHPIHKVMVVAEKVGRTVLPAQGKVVFQYLVGLRSEVIKEVTETPTFSIAVELRLHIIPVSIMLDEQTHQGIDLLSPFRRSHQRSLPSPLSLRDSSVSANFSTSFVSTNL